MSIRVTAISFAMVSVAPPVSGFVAWPRIAQ